MTNNVDAVPSDERKLEVQRLMNRFGKRRVWGWEVANTEAAQLADVIANSSVFDAKTLCVRAPDAAQDFKSNEREFASILIEQLCELTDRNNPACKPDEMVATPAELRCCVERALDKYCFVIAGAGDCEVQS